jgi:hypothetical protein
VDQNISNSTPPPLEEDKSVNSATTPVVEFSKSQRTMSSSAPGAQVNNSVSSSFAKTVSIQKIMQNTANMV